MPSSQALVPETPFPSLDTIYKRPHATLENELCIKQQQQTCYRTLRRGFPLLEINNDDDTIFQCYARFIRDFTGRDEVSFHASTFHGATSRRGLVQATFLGNGEILDTKSAKAVSCVFHERHSTAEDSTDFAVNISSDGNAALSGDITQRPPFATVSLCQGTF